MKILVVDDALPLRELLAAYFQSMGHEVVALDSGLAVEGALASTAFDVVFTDVAMPEVSGWQVLELVRSARPAIPVVMMTGWDAVQPPTPGTARPDAVIEKPFKLDQIRDVLQVVTRGTQR